MITSLTKDQSRKGPNYSFTQYTANRGVLRFGVLPFLILLFLFPPNTLGQVTGDTFRGIPIRSENRCSSYSSDDYPYSQSVEPKISENQGGLFSPYSMRCFVSIRQTDIEHIVARSEAHDSGLCAASPQIREEFSEDLFNLTHAAPLLNRHEKIDKDASEWLPTHNRCWYANRIVEIKRQYGLTIDREEAGALSRILRNCPNVEMLIPTCVDEMPLLSSNADPPCIPLPPNLNLGEDSGLEHPNTNLLTPPGRVEIVDYSSEQSADQIGPVLLKFCNNP